MSWSLSATGTAQSIREQIKAWPEHIAARDNVDSSLTPEAKKGHAAGVAAAERTVGVLLEAFGDKLMAVSAAGHSNTDGSGYVNISYSLVQAAKT